MQISEGRRTRNAVRRQPRQRPRSIGLARSGRPDLAARTEELLEGLGAEE